MSDEGVKVRWHGHGTFSLVSPEGKRILIDPWLTENPACPASDKTLDELDLMLITHGHFDHLQDAVALAGRFQPSIVCIFEIAVWLEQQGVGNVNGMNKGGTQEIDGIGVTMVDARHSSGILQDGKIVYAGEAAGYVIRFEDGTTFYFAGDTCVFGDMKIIADLYEPDVCFLPIGDLYTMDPAQAAYACRLLDARRVVPMHFGTFPPLTGTPEKLAEMTQALGTEIIPIQPGQTVTLGKSPVTSG